MTVITLDTETIGGVIASELVVLGAIVGAVYRYLKYLGYIDIWKKKLTLNIDVVDAAHRQNGNALNKLNMSDDLVNCLQRLAPGENGTIDEEKALECLKDYIKWNNHLIGKVSK